jgi:hypothetical protein
MNVWKLLHWFFFGRALARGPRYFAGYEARRQGRRLLYRATRTRRPRRRRS